MDPNSSEKYRMLPSEPPEYQDNPPAYPSSYTSQPVPQTSYAQGPYPGQPVIAVQPTVYVTAAPLVNPAPDYLGYSIFTMLCCCWPLGIAALVFSISTRNANQSGQRELAETNSRTACRLNNTALSCGLILIVLVIIRFTLMSTDGHNQYP